MRECAECKSAVEEASRSCPSCGAAPPRSRRGFWVFVAAMLVAVAGGGTIVLLTRRAGEARRAEQARVAAETAAAAAAPAPAPAPAVERDPSDAGDARFTRDR